MSTLSFTVLFAQLNCLSNSTSYPTNFKHLVRLRLRQFFLIEANAKPKRQDKPL